MAEKGFLLISDITGYSKYLNQSELEHARDSLTDLLNVLIEQTRLPLVISKPEGDAIFSYARGGSILRGQSLIEMIEITYAAFRRALDLMIINTTCQCNACRNLPNLDLKFFIHFGSFSAQKLGAFTELVGNDVNLVHRLTKNEIKETTGLKAYAAYTEAVIRALSMQELTEGMLVHHETFADVGEVKLFVQDMHGVWDKLKDKTRVEVRLEDALMTLKFEFPVPVPLLWDYVTKPEYQLILLGSDRLELKNRLSGRTGEDTVYYCAHGKQVSRHTVLDWRPFEQYTTNDSYPPPGVTANYTYRVELLNGGSRLTVLIGRARGPWILSKISDVIVRFIISRRYSRGAGLLRQQIEKDVNDGQLSFVAPLAVERAALAQSAAEELNRASGT